MISPRHIELPPWYGRLGVKANLSYSKPLNIFGEEKKCAFTLSNQVT